MKAKTNKNYVPRDISWMYFNHRILMEADKPTVPLLERIGFLGIYSNNLDEFFRVRVAVNTRIAECEDKAFKNEREEALATLKQINKLNAQYAKEFSEVNRRILADLRKENIYVLKESELDAEMAQHVRMFYRQNLTGRLMPIWFSSVKEFSMEKDDCIYMAVRMTSKEVPSRKPGYAFLEIPVATCGRFVRLPNTGERKNLMMLDDVIRYCLPWIFRGTGYDEFEGYSFKFTRDAEMEMENDLRSSTTQKISKGIKSRKHGAPLRVVFDAAMPKGLLRQLMRVLKLDRLDTILASGRYQNHKDYMSFPDCDRRDLKYPAWPSIMPSELAETNSMIDAIRQRDRYIHVPYHTFDAFVNLLQEAAISPHVKAIKMTLYRLAKDSKVVKALIGAARNGKKVTVVIELLARFDEASNITWSKRMQEAGINIIFGVEGLKVHSKLTHISMKTGNDIACISTGNFHEGNARCYTDCMLMTASKTLTHDVDSVFKFIERPYTPVKFKELLVSPNEMRNRFIRLVNDEIRNRQTGKPSGITIKINHITDPEMVSKLYEAAENGVPVRLLLRGNCSLVPTQPALAGNMQITGIIDRYLEHARIFIFTAGGEDKTFIGSADWMPRNLNSRVEVVTPVYDPEIKKDLRTVVEYGLKDTSQGRIVDGTGLNAPLKSADGKIFRSQEELYKHYKENS